MRKVARRADPPCPGVQQFSAIVMHCCLRTGHPGPHLFESDGPGWYRVEWT